MPPSTHLIDLLDLPTQQRQIVQLLLRNGTMLESDLGCALNLLAPEPLSRDALEAELRALTAAGWLARDTLGDEARCWLRSLPRTRKRLDNVWERIDQNDLDGNWQVAIPSASSSTPRAQKRVGALFDALAADETPRQNDGLMQRGGKRTLPGALWERLDDELSGEARAVDPKRSTTRQDLWQKLSKSPKEGGN